jgi:transcriptional regulator with XRE-family HTH domain
MKEAELFGHLVRTARKGRKMTLGQLAEKANTGVKHLGRIERGEKHPSFELIVALAHAMEVSPSIFFRFEDFQMDAQVLKANLQRVLQRADQKQMIKAYRVLHAILEP